MLGSLKDNSGFALILTILIISLIVALTLKFNTSMRSDLFAAARLRDGTKTGYAARSGFNCAIAVLSEDASKTDLDSLREPWAHSKALFFDSPLEFEDSRVAVEIIDLSGKIQLNQLVDLKGQYNTKQKDLLTRLLNCEQFGLHPEEIDNLIDAFKDWIDTDNEVTGFGAEGTYYQALERPYSCKNMPLEFLEELLYVRGITKELYYGTKEKPGISMYLTIHGDGKININTAEPLALKCLSDDIDPEMVAEMVAYREDAENDLKDPGWYKKVPGMSHITIDPDLVTTSSTYFEIKAEGVKGAMTKQVKGIVERKGGTLQILSWKIE